MVATPARKALSGGRAESPQHQTVEDSKPFFVMDWLEKMDEHALALARRVLQTPHKSAAGKPQSQDPASLVKQLFGASSSSLSQSSRNGSAASSPFRKKSIAIGNGWNAKGLEKAKEGKWEDALNCWQNALEIRSQVARSPLDVANTCNNLGIALGRLERFEEALYYLNRALAIRTKEYGTENRTEIATTLHNIGNVHQQAHELDLAIEFFQTSQVIQVKLLGKKHVHVARTFVAIGNVYYQATDYPLARQSYWDALAIFEQAGLPKSDDEVQTVLKDVQDLEKILRRTQTKRTVYE